MYVVTIDEEQFAEAYELAEATMEVFASRPGHYTNSFSSHLRGKVGEIAVTHVLGEFGISCDPLWRDLSLLSSADVHTPSFRADVKSWSSRYWEDLGRCVAVGQLEKLRDKADVVVWCQTHHELVAGMRVAVMGWNSVEEVASAPRLFTGPKSGRQVENYQVPVEDVWDLPLLIVR